MNRTSLGWRFVRIAARSPARWITGPEVARKPTPSSRATIWASVVLPRPGGPCSSTWSRASPRARAAWMNTARFSRLDCWPTNSAKVCGRRDASAASSSRRTGETVRVEAAEDAEAEADAAAAAVTAGETAAGVTSPSPKPFPTEEEEAWCSAPAFRRPCGQFRSSRRPLRQFLQAVADHRIQRCLHRPAARPPAPPPAAPPAGDTRD